MAATQTTPVPPPSSPTTAILPSFTFGSIPDLTTCSSALISWTYNPGSLPGTSTGSGTTANNTGAIDIFLFNDVDPTSTTTLFPREALVKGLSLDTTSWTWNPVAVPALRYRLTFFVIDGTTSTLANSPAFTVNAGSDLSCLSSTATNTSEPSASSSPATIIGAVSKHSSLPTSAIVGIVIGILFLLAIIASGPILLYLSRKSRKGASTFFGHGHHGLGHSGTGGTGTSSSASSVHYVRKQRSVNSLGSEATLVMDHHHQRGRKASTGSLNKLAYAYGYYDKGTGGGAGETGSRESGDSWAHQSSQYAPSPVSEQQHSYNVPGYPPPALPYEYPSRNGSARELGSGGSVGGHSYVSHGTQLSFTTQATQGTQPPPSHPPPAPTQTGQQTQGQGQTSTRQVRKPVPALAPADADELERASLRSATAAASQRSARGGGENQSASAGYAFGEKPMHYLIPDMPPSGRG
ncbi:hypothetical protein BD410DRAFT_789152 [Rickenella mellea]|uniref:Uncharacterized protein n=1 Tax=Rickenella mellea TaxID=50990 RepID=A0A4Y7Q568_9AGAM|nr:hypothetical protein BD410DRAFT_789152 [Rickenella mellea]